MKKTEIQIGQDYAYCVSPSTKYHNTGRRVRVIAEHQPERRPWDRTTNTMWLVKILNDADGTPALREDGTEITRCVESRQILKPWAEYAEIERLRAENRKAAQNEQERLIRQRQDQYQTLTATWEAIGYNIAQKHPDWQIDNGTVRFTVREVLDMLEKARLAGRQEQADHAQGLTNTQGRVVCQNTPRFDQAGNLQRNL